MAHNHPPWMNSNTQLGVPGCRRKFPSLTALKWAAASPFFSKNAPG